jgi:hypothetical protein
MAATEHLSATLFHGTVHPFAPGDVVNPTDTEHTGEPLAYATTDPQRAGSIARVKARMHNRRNPDDQREPLIYEVEHMSEPADIWDVPSFKTTVADARGFRITRRVED